MNVARASAFALVLCAAASATAAQDVGRPVAADTLAVDTLPQPPSPRSVFIKSLILPGWGQAELGSYKRGSVFFALQTTSVFMLLKTVGKLERAHSVERRFLEFAADSLRRVIATDTAAARRLADPIAFEDAVFQNQRVRNARALIESRQRHRQDWITYLLFFTMLSGVDAYVSAHLQDFPADLSARARSDRLELSISVPIGGR